MRKRQHGFSILELLVVVGIGAIAAAVAITSMARATSTANLRESFVDMAAAARRAASSAATGAPATFDVTRDARLDAGLTVNPKYIPAPPGTELASTIDFAGGSGDAFVGGARVLAAVVVAEEGERGFAYAIVVGTGGRVELRTYSAGAWREFK